MSGRSGVRTAPGSALALAVALALGGWAVAAMAATVLLATRTQGRRIGRREGGRETGVEAVTLVVLSGLRAGLSLPAAIGEAAGLLGDPAASELKAILRRARQHGMTAALADATGTMAPLAVLLARSSMNGAAPGPALAAFLDSRRSAERARMLEAARTLPVRLVVPISLLLLPGLVAVTMGPAIVDQLAWLVDGTLP